MSKIDAFWSYVGQYQSFFVRRNSGMILHLQSEPLQNKAFFVKHKTQTTSNTSHIQAVISAPDD